VDESVRAYKLGEAVKKARLAQNLTQEQLGEKVGVKKAQISRVEKGRCMSLTTISRIFRAMSIPLTIEIGNMDKLAMW
ncbi:MAG: helix-turn-helix transcriptional regulator, partial [Bacteroidales bacterium]|nr:helix-turn-helix transcriptional regulator [Bacteroidales bacterium]